MEEEGKEASEEIEGKRAGEEAGREGEARRSQRIVLFAC